MNQRFVKGFARALAFILVIIMVVTSFLVFPFAGETTSSKYVAYGAEAGSAEDTLENDDLRILAAYLKYLHKNYKDVIDYETLINGAFNGATEALNDRFSTFFPGEEEREEFTSSVDGTFEGIGVSISMGVDGKCVVNSPIAGSPALEAGIATGDIITAVDGVSTEGLSLDEISRKLRGEKGTAVEVTVLRGNISMNFSIIRDKINEACISYEMIGDDIGYIKMSGFDNDASSEFKIAKITLTNQGAEKLIIDLRSNPGGYVDEAIEIADEILAEGYITHFSSRGKIIETYSAKATNKTYQPIILLVNGNTASSSEILAAALQDNDGATVVGTTTYGKGIAQQVVSIGDGMSAKISTFYFLTPDKHEIQGVGIKPDIVVENMMASELISAQEQYASFAPMSEKEKPSLGTVGLNVYGAQQRLALLGYDVQVTGTMDQATFQAVKDFQKALGLYVYGVLDYTTATELDKAAIAYVSGSTVTDFQLEKAVEIAKTL